MNEYYKMVGKYYDTDALDFDKRYWQNPILQRIRQDIRENLKNIPFDNALEIGCGTGIDITIKELANMIAKITSYEGEIIWDKSKPDGTYQKLLDVSKLKSLGWISKISLNEGIEKTYNDYQRNLKENRLRNK